jgi:hypothetical protein
MASRSIWGLVIIPQDFESVLGQPLDTSFGLSQFRGHGYGLMCEVALSSYRLELDTHLFESDPTKITQDENAINRIKAYVWLFLEDLTLKSTSKVQNQSIDVLD